MSMPNEELEQILKQLSGKNKVVAKSFLTWLLEKQMDEEDDLLTTEDIQAIEQAHRDLSLGEAVSLEDVKRELQL